MSDIKQELRDTMSHLNKLVVKGTKPNAASDLRNVATAYGIFLDKERGGRPSTHPIISSAFEHLTQTVAPSLTAMTLEERNAYIEGLIAFRDEMFARTV